MAEEEREPLLFHTATVNFTDPESSGEYSPTKLVADAALNVSLSLRPSSPANGTFHFNLCKRKFVHFSLLVASILSGSTRRAQEAGKR